MHVKRQTRTHGRMDGMAFTGSEALTPRSRLVQDSDSAEETFQPLEMQLASSGRVEEEGKFGKTPDAVMLDAPSTPWFPTCCDRAKIY